MSRHWEIVATGLGFPEGPVALADGTIVFVELTGGRVGRVDPATGTVETVAALDGSPNGAALGTDGAIYVANNGGIGPQLPGALFHAASAIEGCVQRVGLDGSVGQVSGPLPGLSPHRPNDLCPDGEGGFFFTDPVNWEELYDGGEYRTGYVFHCAPDGEVETVGEIPDFPNGIGIEPGTGDLIVAQSNTGAMLRLARLEGSRFGPPDVWVDLGTEGYPDGFCWAPDGTLLIAGAISDRIHRVTPAGEIREPLPTFAGADPTNVCIGGDHLWATFGYAGALARIDLVTALGELPT